MTIEFESYRRGNRPDFVESSFLQVLLEILRQRSLQTVAAGHGHLVLQATCSPV